MSKRGVIISGGNINKGFADTFLKELNPEIIIGADSGLCYLYERKIEPTHIVGDFDSVSKEVIDYYLAKGDIPIRQFDPVKDATDTEIALRYAIELGVEQLWILGATGSRVDHMLANIQILKIALDGKVEAYLIDESNRIRLIDKEVRIRKEEAFGQYFSVFPLGGSVEHLSIQGAKYPLQDHTLCPYDSRCVSNQIEADEVRITFPKGYVVLIESREER